MLSVTNSAVGATQLTIRDRLSDTESTWPVEPESDLLVHDGTTLHLIRQLRERVQGVEQHGNEQDTSSSERSGSGLREVVETGTGDEGDGDTAEGSESASDQGEGGEKSLRSEETRVQGQFILQVQDELTLGQGPDLREERDGVWRLFRDTFSLVLEDGATESFLTGAVLLQLLLVGESFGLYFLIGGALEVGLLELLGGGRGVALVATLVEFTVKTSRSESLYLSTSVHGLPLVLIGTPSQEVSSRLPRLVLPTHVQEILPGLVSRSKVDLVTLVDDQDLVELLVDTFAGLVEGDEGGHFPEMQRYQHRDIANRGFTTYMTSVSTLTLLA